MESIAQSQVFFIITSVAVGIVTLLIIILLIYLIKIAHKFWKVTREYGNEALEFKHIVSVLRKKVTGFFGGSSSKKGK
jgi:uncharacterized protein YoxC